jgi:dienelactone hydrolase
MSKLTPPLASTYIAYPPDNKSPENAILFLTDVFGHSYINNQLIADQFAANGYLVYMPDLFLGNPSPVNRGPDFDLAAFRARNTFEVIDPIVDAAIKELRENLNVKRIGAAGYCFGAKYTTRFLKKGQIDAGYVAHPSWVTVEEVKGIEGPLAIAAAGMFVSLR